MRPQAPSIKKAPNETFRVSAKPFLATPVAPVTLATMKTPSFRPYLLPSFLLALSGWAGLYFLVNYTLPTLGPRWAFFFLATLALSGSALPIVYFLHRRFNLKNFPPSQIITRQALWVGVYGATLAWLQLGKVANLSTVIGLALGLIAIETLIRIREKAQWTPPEIDYDESP